MIFQFWLESDWLAQENPKLFLTILSQFHGFHTHTLQVSLETVYLAFAKNILLKIY